MGGGVAGGSCGGRDGVASSCSAWAMWSVVEEIEISATPGSVNPARSRLDCTVAAVTFRSLASTAPRAVSNDSKPSAARAPTTVVVETRTLRALARISALRRTAPAGAPSARSTRPTRAGLPIEIATVSTRSNRAAATPGSSMLPSVAMGKSATNTNVLARRRRREPGAVQEAEVAAEVAAVVVAEGGSRSGRGSGRGSGDGRFTYEE